MIDIESWVYTQIVTALRTAIDSDISTSSDPAMKPAKFPHVVIEQQDSSTVPEWATRGSMDNLNRVMFQVDVYTNTLGTRKSEAKRVMAVVCDWMSTHNFTRISLMPVAYNDSIYRLTARFTANVDMIVTTENGVTTNDYGLYQN